jgi:hypothetical protein
MKLRTIWTLRAMSFRERVERTREWMAMFVAARLPLRVRYWATIIEVGEATKNSTNVPATPLHEIMSNLRCPKSMV